MLKVLYFSTTWCGPCKAMAPIITEAANSLDIQKIDAEQNPDLTRQYSVTTVPTFIFLKNGQEVGRKSGAMRKADFDNLARTYA